jgi:hypothetical protein
MFRVTETDENSEGHESFELTYKDGRQIYGSVNGHSVVWNWALSDYFSPSERLDALQKVNEVYNLV